MRAVGRTGHQVARIVVAAGLVVVAAAGCSSSGGSKAAFTAGKEGVSSAAGASGPSVTPVASPVGVGSTASFHSQYAGEEGTTLEVTLDGVEYRSSIVRTGSSPAIPNRGVYALVSLTVANTGASPGLFNSPNLVWVSPDGQAVRDTAVLVPDVTPGTESLDSTVQPGQHVTGTAVFDVPARGGQLQYEITGQAPLFVLQLPPS
ncbi:uncharacterized protein DUF4352 [Kitasatospora cineracea]|uniref:Uncharacterized protein DUF4352 n=1 Tax=Kitasatospora cineracea TaxID=88074 RepID=A0A3N4R5L7_9ACTN|nr:uncharacterized protein DUF4352 [Kitasatospora cineracea]